MSRRQRREVEDLLARARSFIGHLRVRTEPPEATLRVDDAPARPNEEGVLVLDLGEHVLEATREGWLPERRRVEVRGGEDLDLTLALRPVPPPPAPVGRSGPPIAAIGLFLGAGGALVVEAWSIGWLVDRQSELDACVSPPDGFRCDNRGALTDQRYAAIGTTVAMAIAAVVLAGVGALVWWLDAETEDPSADETAAGGTVSCGPGGAGLSCRF